MKDLDIPSSVTTAEGNVSPARQRKSVIADPSGDSPSSSSHADSTKNKQPNHQINDNLGKHIKDTLNGQKGSNRSLKHPSLTSEILRVLLLSLFFFISCFFIFISQLLGCLLYLYDKDRYYTWIARTKRHFGLLIIVITQIWSPTAVIISGDESVAGQIRSTGDGGTGVELAFPERMVLVANHQLYTDWLYLWWSAYTSTTRAHGNLFIILKQSLRWVPLLGTGMSFYGFIWVSRNWAVDRIRFKHRLDQLKQWRSKSILPLSLSQSHQPKPVLKPQRQGQEHFNKETSETSLPPAPFWLLIFPEGTNLSPNTRAKSQSWAVKSGQEDLKHLLLPRHTGLLFCLRELQGSVDWLYDCTMGYGGVSHGEYGSDIYTLCSIYFLSPSSSSSSSSSPSPSPSRTPTVHLHWRRFALSTIPLAEGQEAAFEHWVANCWRDKDKLMDGFVRNGSFVADDDDDDDHDNDDYNDDNFNRSKNKNREKKKKGQGTIETEIKLNNPLEFLTLMIPGVAFATVVYLVCRVVTETIDGFRVMTLNLLKLILRI